tara:strand:- start:10368 stop:11117 length:750 start_codon:yes stop_codon:yes gene_type:complete
MSKKIFLEETVLLFSDIDDTILCSKGWPKGIDEKCEGIDKNCKGHFKTDIYPNVCEFFKSNGVNTIGILTARPSIMTTKLASQFEAKPEFANNNLKIGPILSGCILRSALRLFSNESLGTCKYIRLKDFIEKHKTIIQKGKKKIIFVGDNGQGDEYTASLLFSDKDIRPFIKKIYIHDVRGYDSKFKLENSKVVYFNNYKDLLPTEIDAARRLYSGAKPRLKKEFPLKKTRRRKLPKRAKTRRVLRILI